ncbi:MAG: hypothetical protein MI923_17830 [Phycisphaerales bacterium]|nr:hypothetical protein [Phycisphaerales bacterium]
MGSAIALRINVVNVPVRLNGSRERFREATALFITDVTSRALCAAIFKAFFDRSIAFGTGSFSGPSAAMGGLLG